MTDPTPESVDIVADAESDDPKIRAAHEKLVKELVADADSTQGTLSYSPGNHPDEITERDAEQLRLTELTDLERIELDHGFIFSTSPDPDEAPPSASLICRNPECDRNGQHVAVNYDTAQPITCGGLITDQDGNTRPCGTVLLCDHTTYDTATMTGTLAAPIKITTTTCTKCGTTTATNREEQPPVNLANLPIGILDTIGTTPGDTTFDGGRADSL